jgi:hypothetical protein
MVALDGPEYIETNRCCHLWLPFLISLVFFILFCLYICGL